MTRRKMIRRVFLHVLPISSLFGHVSVSGKPAASGAGTRRSVNVAQAWGTLEGLLTSNSAQTRKYAIGALELIAGKHSRARKLIERTLATDKDAEVRSYAASSLGQGKIRAAMPALRTALRDNDAAVAFAAAKALADMGDRSGSDLFQKVLRGETAETPGLIEGAIRDAKRTMRDPKQLALIGVREAAGALLGPASMAITFAEEGLKDKGATARALSARLLAADKSEASRQALLYGLGDSNTLVRVAACQGLAMQGNRSSLPQIEALLDGKNEAIRAMAASSVIRLSAHSSRNE